MTTVKRLNPVSRVALMGGIGFALLLGLSAFQQEPAKPLGPFGLSQINTRDGKRASIDDFYLSQDCSLCHPRQWTELRGSMHDVAHEDSLYRHFAELAREEAGEEVYTYCSSCHSPAGVATGLIPLLAEQQLPPEARAGVTCDVCHQISDLRGEHGPLGEQGNASFILEPGRKKFGPYENISRNPAHSGARFEALGTSEFCATCHTVAHPVNGLRIEHTYDEWKNSIYAEKGIQCQDCHMNTVEDALIVARTLEPVKVMGTLARKGPEREISPHYFVGGNIDAATVGGGARHASMARERLRTAASLVIEAPVSVAPQGVFDLDVVVTNVAAGHDLPTSLTELREMWVRILAFDADGKVVFESGTLDPHGEIPEGSIRFGSGLVDAEGKPTIRPWEAVDFGWKRTVPPKGSARDRVRIVLQKAKGPVTIEASLLYRVAPPHVLKEVMGEDAFDPEVIVMATATHSVTVER